MAYYNEASRIAQPQGGIIPLPKGMLKGEAAAVTAQVEILNGL